MLIPGIIASSFAKVAAPASGYNLWLDAADTATISVSGSAVTQWTDKSANAYTFTQGTAGNRPSSGTRTINSKNVIDFDGGDVLSSTAAASTWNFLHNTGDSTWFYVFLPDDITSTQILFATNGAFGDKNGAWHLISSSDHNFRVTVDPAGAVSSVSAAATISTAVLYTVKSDTGNATAADRLKYYKDLGSATGSNTATATPTDNNAYQTLQIGATSTGTLGFNGAIAEMLFYPGLLSDSDRVKTRDYLLAKWGI